MTTNLYQVKDILRNQAIARVLGEIKAAKITYYGGESDTDPLYSALQRAEKDIRDNW